MKRSWEFHVDKEKWSSYSSGLSLGKSWVLLDSLVTKKVSTRQRVEIITLWAVLVTAGKAVPWCNTWAAQKRSQQDDENESWSEREKVERPGELLWRENLHIQAFVHVVVLQRLVQNTGSRPVDLGKAFPSELISYVTLANSLILSGLHFPHLYIREQ